jgi:glycosyltransferase 2 family protein
MPAMPDAQPDPTTPAGWRNLRRRFIGALVLALALYMALAAYGDFGMLRANLRAFPWAWLPAILGLTLVNYVGRLVKWLWYLRLVGSPIGRADGTKVFGIGMSMVLTPGKAGELLKSYMVRNASGTPMRLTAPIVVSERLTDGLAMLILVGIGLLGFDDPTIRRGAALLVVVLGGFVVAVRMRRVAMPALALGERTPLARRFALQMRALYESTYHLLGPRNLAIAIGIGVVSWVCEGLAFYVVLLGVAPDLPRDATTALTAVFIFSVSTILGALAATPGGLGAIEASLVALSQRLLGLDATTATAAALLVRFATLWFGVGLGLISLALWSHLLEPPANAPPDAATPPSGTRESHGPADRAGL